MTDETRVKISGLCKKAKQARILFWRGSFWAFRGSCLKSAEQNLHCLHSPGVSPSPLAMDAGTLGEGFSKAAHGQS